MSQPFVAEIKKIVIEDGKQVAKVEMLIPKANATKIEMVNVKISVTATQQKMFNDNEE